MKVAFITASPIAQGPHGPTSQLASLRYRVLSPARQLAAQGHGVQIITTPAQGWPATFSQQLAVDAVIFSKSFSTHNEDLAAALRQRGVPVHVDLCDDHSEHPQLAGHFQRLIELADVLTVSTPTLGESIHARTGKTATVISDPVEGQRHEPAFDARLPRLKLLWFGHPSNLGALLLALPSLAELSRTLPLSLTVVTDLSAAALSAFAAREYSPDGVLPVKLEPWSVDSTFAALANCDAVILPALLNTHAAAKSPNRLTESIWAGRYAIAHPIPAYSAFSQGAWIGERLIDGISDAVLDPANAVRKIRQGQRQVAREHSPYRIGLEWLSSLGQSAPPLRLNLGCGDKILPGYVNVDVAPSRNGKVPDVQCDLHDLVPFSNNSADEILSVHVVEHFWRWEIEAVLREWVRVLKPGGRMVIECPNLGSACSTFLADPSQQAHGDARGQRSMWVFYGDPAWQDPLMVHRWGYTPESLAELLKAVGLTQVRQEPAQFKLREPRDMRVVGFKASA